MDAAALTLPFLVGLILVALAFDFLNGMNDAANAIATIVSTRVLRPQLAVAWAAFFNFVAFLFFGLHVAETVGRGIVEADIVNEHVIFGALAGAIVWQIVTQRLGIPSSSSHALIGGLVGSGIAKAGFSAVVWAGVWKTAVAIFLSPGVGCLLALLLMLLVSWLFVRFTPHGVDHIFRRAQFVSASLYALGHGGNDAQKTMGIIAVLLYSQGHLGGNFYVPFWVVLTCQIAMALGTLAGGSRIVRTMGSKITRLTPMQGFCAETGGSITLFAATWLGVPVSTTHTITGSIIGVGAAEEVCAPCDGSWRANASRPGSSRSPAAGFLAALFYWLSGLVVEAALDAHSFFTDLSNDVLVQRQCPLLGVKRTSLFAVRMSANDPKRTRPHSMDDLVTEAAMKAVLITSVTHDELVILGRLAGAVLIGALIGFERSFHGRPAGFRTHALVCLASALLMLRYSLSAALDDRGTASIPFAPTRPAWRKGS